MKSREDIIHEYFAAWLTRDSSPIKNNFADDILYSECYGPEYQGLDQIVKWFEDWNNRGTVLEWNIKQFIHAGNATVVEWYFKCEYDGVLDGFDGVSIINFNAAGKIVSLKEFQSKAKHYRPYNLANQTITGE